MEVEFVSKTVKRYDYKLALDIPMVGENLHSIPVLAECCVPKVSLMQEVLDFGECFLRYEYTLSLTLNNESKLPAKYEVLPQDEQSKGLAVYVSTPSSGDVAGRGSVEIQFTLSTERIGVINLPVRARLPTRCDRRDDACVCVVFVCMCVCVG